MLVTSSDSDEVLRDFLRMSMLHTGITGRDAAALAVLASDVHTRELPLLSERRFIERDEFVEYASELGLSVTIGDTLWIVLREQWAHLNRTQPSASRLSNYLGLTENGLTTRAQIARTPSAALAQTLAISSFEAVRLRPERLPELEHKRTRGLRDDRA